MAKHTRVHGDHPADPVVNDDLLRTLLQEHGLRVRRRIALKLPTYLKSVVDPDDLAQEVWIAAFLRSTQGNWDSIEGFERWLTTVIASKVNTCIIHHNRLKRAGNLGNGDFPHPWEDDSCDSPACRLVAAGRTPSREAAAHEAAGEIAGVLHGLPETSRQIVCMRYVEGHSIARIAEVCTLTESAVRSHLYRSIGKLRRGLGWSGRFFTDAGSLDDSSP